jgi:hypothetical protein
MSDLPSFGARKICRTANRRRGTRIPCNFQLTLSSLDTAHPFAEPCLVVVINPQGCGLKFIRPLEIGTRVRLDGLPGNRSVTAQVVTSISLGEYEKFWFLGLSLDEHGNVWGITNPPEDWIC